MKEANMAKLELSSTLRNLKFMQRASLKEQQKPNNEDDHNPKLHQDIGSSPPPARRCIVIMEGDPHPGALKGRMSFQSFNPSIDKIHEEATKSQQLQANFSCNNHQNRSFDRLSRPSATEPEDSNVGCSKKDLAFDLKRKRPQMDSGRSPQHNSGDGSGVDEVQSSSQDQQKNPSHRRRKREKVDWNVLRPPKVRRDSS